jgi:hypothetical protein
MILGQNLENSEVTYPAKTMILGQNLENSSVALSALVPITSVTIAMVK